MTQPAASPSAIHAAMLAGWSANVAKSMFVLLDLIDPQMEVAPTKSARAVIVSRRPCRTIGERVNLVGRKADGGPEIEDLQCWRRGRFGQLAAECKSADAGDAHG